MATISVIIPVYERAELLERAIQSALGATRLDLEVIVVDDGSPSDLRRHCPALGNPRVYYLRQPNRGTGAARNAGIAAAHGAFVAFLDSDDVLEPAALDHLHGVLARTPQADIAHGWATVVDHAEIEVQLGRPQLQGWAFRQYLLKNQTPIGTVMIRRACLDAGHRFDEQLLLLEDWDFFLRLSFHYQFACVPAVVARIYMQPEQRSSSRLTHEVGAVALATYRKLLADPVARPFVQKRWHQLMANVHVVMGHQYRVFDGNLAAARREFLRAAWIAPAFWPAYAGFAEAIAGRQVIRGLRQLRSRLYAHGRARRLSGE